MIYIDNLEQGESFLGFNRSTDKTPFTVIGIPLDISSSFRSGCNEAPQRIRYVSKSLELCSIHTEIDFECIGFEDIGNITLIPGDMINSLKRIEQISSNLVKNKNRIIFALGGEHTITLPLFKSIASGETSCLVVFDAHADLRDQHLGSRYNHATVIRRITEETHGRIILIGTRALSREEIEAYRMLRNRITMFKVQHENLSNNLMNYLSKEIELCKEIHISIDMDVFDPAYAPGVQTPEPMGLDPHTFLKMIPLIANDKVRIIDVVEVAPTHDRSDITSFLAARIVIEIAASIYKNIYNGDNKCLCRI